MDINVTKRSPTAEFLSKIRMDDDTLRANDEHNISDEAHEALQQKLSLNLPQIHSLKELRIDVDSVFHIQWNRFSVFVNVSFKIQRVLKAF